MTVSIVVDEIMKFPFKVTRSYHTIIINSSYHALILIIVQVLMKMSGVLDDEHNCHTTAVAL